MKGKVKMTIHNKKYKTLEEFLDYLKSSIVNLLIVKGEAGFGKTHHIKNFLKDNEINYVYITNYATPLSFYQLLYENRDKEIIVFDDVQTIDNPLIVSTLKSACFSIDENRVISYYSTSKKLEEMKLPKSFKFNSKVILIFNDDIKEFEPLIDRGLIIDISFPYKEKLKILKKIEKEIEADKEVLSYIRSVSNEATRGITIRTYLTFLRVKLHQGDYKNCINEIFNSDGDLSLLIDLLQKCTKKGDITKACKKWCEETGHHERTFYNKKKELGL